MEKKGSIIGGIILILLGVFFFLLQFFPGLADLFNLSQQWPLIIIGAGVLFLLGALFGNPPLAVPGMIISGTGVILYYQNATGDWGKLVLYLVAVSHFCRAWHHVNEQACKAIGDKGCVKAVLWF